MRKKSPLILIGLIVIVLLFYYSFNLYQLVVKAYYVDESKLYQIDTFHLLNRAYEQSGNSGGRNSGSKPELVFESINRYSFVIDRDIFQAITDKKKLKDTLMYHDLKFTVFSDKDTYEKYWKNPKPIVIQVYQIQIGDTKYIDVSRLNAISKGSKIAGVVLPPALILFLGFLLFKEAKGENWWTNRRMTIWFLAFVITIIGLFLLT